MKICIRQERGFTLVELLVVIAIIGILAAIAIPQITAYRQRGFDARSLSDLRNAAAGEEVYFAEHERYTDCIGTAACQGTLPGFHASPDVVVSMYWVSATAFSGMSYHPQGTRSSIAFPWQWRSNNGGLQ